MNIKEAKFCNKENSAVIVETNIGDFVVELTNEYNNCEFYKEYIKWSENNITKDFIEPKLNNLDLAESWISNFFSPLKLLQMKSWWDTLPHESTPKLVSSYDWLNQVVLSATNGSLDFNSPPYIFEEILSECINIQ